MIGDTTYWNTRMGPGILDGYAKEKARGLVHTRERTEEMAKLQKDMDDIARDLGWKELRDPHICVSDVTSPSRERWSWAVKMTVLVLVVAVLGAVGLVLADTPWWAAILPAASWALIMGAWFRLIEPHL